MTLIHRRNKEAAYDVRYDLPKRDEEQKDAEEEKKRQDEEEKKKEKEEGEENKSRDDPSSPLACRATASTINPRADQYLML